MVYALTEYLGTQRFRNGQPIFPEGVNRFSCLMQGGGHQEAAPPDELRANAALIQHASTALPAYQQALEEAMRILQGVMDVYGGPAVIVEVQEAGKLLRDWNGVSAPECDRLLAALRDGAA